MYSRKRIFVGTRNHSIARKPGSGRLSKVTAEIKALFEQQMHIDDETTAHQLHQLLQSRGYKISLCTVLCCRKSLGWTFRGSAYCQLVRNNNKQKRREWAKANLMDANLKTFCGLMSVVYKWRATGDFAAGKSETLQSLSQGTCTGPTFLKARTVCIMQAHMYNAKIKTQSHLLVNTF